MWLGSALGAALRLSGVQAGVAGHRLIGSAYPQLLVGHAAEPFAPAGLELVELAILPGLAAQRAESGDARGAALSGSEAAGRAPRRSAVCELPGHDQSGEDALAVGVDGPAVDAERALAEVKPALVPVLVLVFDDQLHAGRQFVVAAERRSNLVAL